MSLGLSVVLALLSQRRISAQLPACRHRPFLCAHPQLSLDYRQCSVQPPRLSAQPATATAGAAPASPAARDISTHSLRPHPTTIIPPHQAKVTRFSHQYDILFSVSCPAFCFDLSDPFPRYTDTLIPPNTPRNSRRGEEARSEGRRTYEPLIVARRHLRSECDQMAKVDCDAVQAEESPSSRRSKARHDTSLSKAAALLAILAATPTSMAQSCVPLKGSRMCPAWDASSITTGGEALSNLYV